jgi:hypothetical protein
MPHEWRKCVLLHQFAVGHRSDPDHPRHGLLEPVCYFPPIETERELVQVAVQMLYRKLVVCPYGLPASDPPARRETGCPLQFGKRPTSILESGQQTMGSRGAAIRCVGWGRLNGEVARGVSTDSVIARDHALTVPRLSLALHVPKSTGVAANAIGNSTTTVLVRRFAGAI